ncbi:hypothetical protein TCE0_044f16091 [Talaromyces pinophilus]|uniref:ABC transporter n=1 Tax=Talaromyces pinophilus TaxID=128442 RepID=A0A478ECK2_TALPI|nr:hypothetical protein TCE0_044f16091 [Talaromyces pinophilus]
MEVGKSFDEPTHLTRSEPEKSQHSTQHTVLEQAEGADAEKAEQKRVKKGNDRVYSYYVEAAGRRNFITFIFCLAGLVFGLSFPQTWVSWWTSSSNGSYKFGNSVYIGVYFALAGFSMLCIAAGGLALMVLVVPNSAKSLHTSMARTLFRAPVLWVLQRDDGEVINRFSQDLGLVDAAIPESTFVTIFAILTCIAQTIYICISSRYLAILIVACIFVLYLVQTFYLRTSRQLRILDLEATGPLVSHALEAIQGNTTINALGWDTAFQKRQLELLDRSQRAYYLLPMVQRWLGFVLDTIVAGIATVLVALTLFVKGSATTTFLGAGLTGIVSFALNVNTLIQNWTMLETSIQGIWRIKIFCEATPSEETFETTVPLGDWPSSGRVTFQNVYASYVAGAIDVLEDISFTVEAGQKVGICGRTGSGKSSLLSALSRVLQVSRGSITIDGLDINCIPPDVLREKFLALPQDAILVPGNVRENLDPGATLSESECIIYLQKVGLWEFLKARGGLDATVNEKLLSAGQGQLLVLGRALAHPKQVILMDEITSSLDSKTDYFIRNLIQDNFKKNTIVKVEHKLENLLECDKVVVVSNGRLQEYDNPRVLLEQPESHFRALFH